MSGRGESTVREIAIVVVSLIIEMLWGLHVKYPDNNESVQALMKEMDAVWQFVHTVQSMDFYGQVLGFQGVCMTLWCFKVPMCMILMSYTIK